MAATNILVSAFPSPVSSEGTTTLRIVAHSDDTAKGVVADNAHVIFALDVSGSMYGSGLDNAKQGVQGLLANIKNAMGDDVHITLIEYGTDTKTTQNPSSTYISNIVTYGWTNFGKASDEILRQLRHDVSKTIVIFLTDGSDTCGTDIPQTAKHFKKTIDAHKCDVDVHAIAFTDNADINTCNAFAYNGMVRYCKSSNDLSGIITELTDYMNFSSTRIMYNGKNVVVDDDGVGYVFVTHDISDVTLCVLTSGREEMVKVHVTRDDDPPYEHVIDSTIRYIMSSLKSWTTDLASTTSDGARRVLVAEGMKVYAAHRESVDAIRSKLVSDRALRKQYSKFEPVFVQFAEFGNALADAARSGLDNHRLGVLCHTASSMGTMKRSLARRADEMIARGAERFLDVDEKARAAAQNASALPDMESETCFVTGCTTSEALAEGDGMGICVKVARPESGAGIADPTRVRILDIGPFISTDGWEQALIMHGSADGTIKASDGKTYNAMLPLGVDDVTWIRSQMAVAHITTGTPFAFAWNQMTTIHFLAYSHIMNQPSSEYQQKIASLLHDTCTYFMKRMSPDVVQDGMTRMSDRIRDHMDALANGDMTKVTVDELPSISLFWSQLRIFGGSWDDDAVQRVVNMLYEEQVRRNGFHENEVPSIGAAFGYSYDVHVKPYVEPRKQQLREASQNASASNDYLVYLNGGTPIEAASSSAPTTTTTTNIAVEANADDIDVSFDVLCKLPVVRQYNDALRPRNPDVLDDIQWFCLAHQANADATNSKRRDRITSNSYYNPFDKDCARLYVVNMFRQYVASERRRMIADYMSSLASRKGNELVDAFLNAPNADQAAGVLVGLKFMMGTQTFKQLYMELSRCMIDDVPDYFKKIRMIIWGYHDYNGKLIRVYGDAYGWSMSKRNRMRFVRGSFNYNPDTIKEEDWKQHVEMWIPYFKMSCHSEADIDHWSKRVIALQNPYSSKNEIECRNDME